MIKRFQKTSDFQSSEEISLPPMLYKPNEAKDEANAEVSTGNEGQLATIMHVRELFRRLAEIGSWILLSVFVKGSQFNLSVCCHYTLCVHYSKFSCYFSLSSVF